MQTLAELRRAIKPLGFKIKTQTMSWGRHATYVRLSDNRELTYNVFTPEDLAQWNPLFDWLRDHTAEVLQVGATEDLRGLLPISNRSKWTETPGSGE